MDVTSAAMSDVRLISAGDDIKLWDSTNFSLCRQLNPHDHNVSCITLSHNNSLLASTSLNNDKVALNFVNNPVLSEIILPTKCGALCVDFNSRSRFLVIGRSDHAISIYDCKAKNFKKTYEEHKGPVTSVQFNWNDTSIVSGSETGEIILHNIVTAQASKPLIAPNVQAIRQLQYSYYKKSLLASASDDGCIHLWDTNMRRLIHSFSGAHRAPATGLVFSSINDALLCSVGLDKRIQFLDVNLKTLVNTITAESPITSVDMMYDGSTLAVGSTRGKVYIYDMRQTTTPVKILNAHRSSVQSIKFKKNPELMGHSKSQSSERNPRVSPTLRRQLPSAPATDSVIAPMKQPEFVKYEQRNPVRIEGAGVEDVFSPIREGYDDSREGINRTSRGNETTDSGSDVGGGLFSPLADNLAIGGSRRYQTNDGSYTRSPLAGGASTSLSFTRGNSYTVPQQADVNMYGTPTRISSTATLEASPLLSQPPVSSRSSGTLQIPSSSASLFTGSTGRGISASPSLLTFQGTEEGGEAATGMANGPIHVHSRNITTNQKQVVVPPVDVFARSPEGAVASSHELAYRGYRDRLADRGDHSAGVSSGVQEAQPFQQQVIRNLIQEALEDFREEVHRDMVSLHMEMIRQFHIQLAETRSMMQQYSLNSELLEEIERLREENKRLKKTF